MLVLNNITKQAICLGSRMGNETLKALRDLKSPDDRILVISMQGIQAVDLCFIRNGIAAFSKMFCGELGVVVTNIENNDVLDNIRCGFSSKGMPLVTSALSHVAIDAIDAVNRPLLGLCYANKTITSHEVANRMDWSIPRASQSLKTLANKGYLLCTQGTALSGGREHSYQPFIVTQQLQFFK